MPSKAEFYFITAMMILIFIVCGVSLYFFFVTYKKEMREKRERLEKKRAEAESRSEQPDSPGIPTQEDAAS